MRRIYLGSLLLGMLTSASISADPAPDGNTIDIRGDVWNGTIDGPQKIDRISLILPQNVNQVIASLENAGPEFVFKNVPMSTGPLQIRAEYRGEVFGRIVSSSRATLARKQRITVYERGAPEASIRITMMTQVIKRKNRLQILEIFSVSNSSHPPRVFYADSFPLRLSRSASEPRVLMQNEGAGIPEPVTPAPMDQGYGFEYGFKPGVTGISVEYEIPGNEVSFDDFFIISRDGKKIAAGPRVLLWQPAGTVPEVIGGRQNRITVPEIGEALSIDHEGGAITVRMRRGGYLISDPAEAQYNPVFDGVLTTLVGLFGSLFAILVFVYLKAKRKSAPASKRKR